MTELEIREKYKQWAKTHVTKIWRDKIEDLLIQFLKHIKLL